MPLFDPSPFVVTSTHGTQAVIQRGTQTLRRNLSALKRIGVHSEPAKNDGRQRSNRADTVLTYTCLPLSDAHDDEQHTVDNIDDAHGGEQHMVDNFDNAQDGEQHMVDNIDNAHAGEQHSDDSLDNSHVGDQRLIDNIHNPFINGHDPVGGTTARPSANEQDVSRTIDDTLGESNSANNTSDNVTALTQTPTQAVATKAVDTAACANEQLTNRPKRSPKPIDRYGDLVGSDQRKPRTTK